MKRYNEEELEEKFYLRILIYPTSLWLSESLARQNFVILIYKTNQESTNLMAFAHSQQTNYICKQNFVISRISE